MADSPGFEPGVIGLEVQRLIRARPRVHERGELGEERKDLFRIFGSKGHEEGNAIPNLKE